MALRLTTTEKAVCRLISFAAFGDRLTLPAETDWQAVYEELSQQTVLSLFRNSLDALPLPEDVRAVWEKQACCIVTKNYRVMAGQRKLIKLLESHGIRYAILKGTAAAQYYPVENSRSLGDVDFIVKEEDYERTQRLLDENGYVRSFEYEDNDRHESFDKNAIHYECHHLFAGRGKLCAKEIDERITGSINHAIVGETELGPFLYPPTAVNGLVLLEHVSIHIKAGLGLRQIMDWLFYAEKHLRDEDWRGENGAVIREAGLETLAKVITRAGQMYFGLRTDITWCAETSEELCGELIRLVFSYGNFGNKNTVADDVVGVARRYRRGILSNLMISGAFNWKILHKYPWLRPLAPIYQIFRYAKQVLSRKGALKALLFSKKAVDDREQLMRELGI